MRFERFDLNLLVVLDALLEEKNVTRAAERLHIGQSAASGSLARLRDYFGDELLVMVGRQLRLTPLATTLVQPVRESLLSVKAAISATPEFDPGTATGNFTVCASDYVTTVMLADALQRISKMAPNLMVDVRGPPKDVFELTERGSIDLLVMPEQYMERLTYAKQRWFTDDQICMVCARNTQVGDAITFDEYMAMGHVAVRFGDARAVTFEGWFLPRYGKQRRIEIGVDNFSTLPLLIIGTNRIATIHRRMAEHFARYLPVRLIPPPFEIPTLVAMMCWPPHRDKDPAHQWFRSMLIESANPSPV
jgi:LysR family transcriptional regulator, nod-box dependent transcriptional activator